MKSAKRPFKAGERCLTCSKELDGRFDKIFCNDLCRAKYHNRKKSADERCVRAINKILLKNREALKDIGVGDKSNLKKICLSCGGSILTSSLRQRNIKGERINSAMNRVMT